MTDRESKLIERLMQGDIGAYDELCPNAKPEHREKVKSFLKSVRQYDGKALLWIAWFMFLTGNSIEDISEGIRMTAEKENRAFADAWDRCIDDIVNKQE